MHTKKVSFQPPNNEDGDGGDGAGRQNIGNSTASNSNFLQTKLNTPNINLGNKSNNASVLI